MIQTNLLKDPPLKALIYFSLPILLGNLFQLLYSLVDSIVVGQFVGPLALGSIGAVFPLVFFIQALSFGVSNAASILLGQHMGAFGTVGIKRLAYSSLFYAMLVAALLGFVFFPLALRLLAVLQLPDVLLANSLIYFQTTIVGIVFVFGFQMMASIFRAMGDSQTPLIYLSLAAVLNIGFDLLFVIVFGWGVFGVAIATLMAQALAFALIGWQLIKRLKPLDQGPLFQWTLIRQVMNLSIVTSSQEMMITLGILFTQILINRMGAEVVAAYTAGSRVNDIVLLPIINLSIGMTVFTAQNMGAHQIDRVYHAYHSALRLMLGFASMMALIVWLNPEALLKLFLGSTIDPLTLTAGKSYLMYSIASFFLMALLFPAESLLKGAGDVKMFMVIAVSGSLVKVVLAWLLIPSLGYQGIWLGIVLGWGAEAVLTHARYLSKAWHTKVLIQKL